MKKLLTTIIVATIATTVHAAPIVIDLGDLGADLTIPDRADVDTGENTQSIMRRVIDEYSPETLDTGTNAEYLARLKVLIRQVGVQGLKDRYRALKVNEAVETVVLGSDAYSGDEIAE